MKNIEMLKKIVFLLGDLVDDVIFVGGSIVDLLITDEAYQEVRVTNDVDIILKIERRSQYYSFSEKLRLKGFQEDREIICRWNKENYILDVMPTDDSILGFSNKWYKDAFENSKSLRLDNKEIKIISAPFFIATKLEAFEGRGNSDYYCSKDFEDIITIFDGREDIVSEVLKEQENVKHFIQNKLSIILDNQDFLNALPGLIPQYSGGILRQKTVLIRMKRIVDSN